MSDTEDQSPTRHPRKSVQPKLNTWDVPEFLPGAMPSATAVQKALFEARSIKVFKSTVAHEHRADEAYKKRMEIEKDEKFKNDLKTLFHMFPKVDSILIQESYLSLENDMNATIQQLLTLCEDMSPKKSPPRSDDETEFPPIGKINDPKDITMHIEDD